MYMYIIMKGSYEPAYEYKTPLRPSIVHYALRAANIGGHFLDVEKSGRCL